VRTELHWRFANSPNSLKLVKLVLDGDIGDRRACLSKCGTAVATGSDGLYVHRTRKAMERERTVQVKVGAGAMSSVEENGKVASPCVDGLIRDRQGHMVENRKKKRKRRARRNSSLTPRTSAAPVASNISSDTEEGES